MGADTGEEDALHDATTLRRPRRYELTAGGVKPILSDAPLVLAFCSENGIIFRPEPPLTQLVIVCWGRVRGLLNELSA